MSRRPDAVPPGEPSSQRAGRPPDRWSSGHRAPRSRRTEPGSPLDALLDTGPGFGHALRGYDRAEVDNFVVWAESELLAARRENDDLVTRYAECAAEREISRRLLARSPSGQELTLVSERIGRMLRMAADEATELTAAATEEADRIVADARADADARLRKAHEIKELAVASGDHLLEEARRLREDAAAELAAARVQAQAELDRARTEAEQLTHAADRERRARETELRAELDELHRQQAVARETLRRLTEQIDEALHALAGAPQAPVELVIVGNVARG